MRTSCAFTYSILTSEGITNPKRFSASIYPVKKKDDADATSPDVTNPAWWTVSIRQNHARTVCVALYRIARRKASSYVYAKLHGIIGLVLFLLEESAYEKLCQEHKVKVLWFGR